MVLKWLVAIGIAAAIIPLGIHQIPEGHVGIYYRSIQPLLFEIHYSFDFDISEVVLYLQQ